MSFGARIESPGEGSAEAAPAGVESLIAAWTAERPRPEYWIETGGLERARSELQTALHDRAAAVVVTGPSGHGKTTLLRSFWQHPGSGFSAVFVPALRDVEPNQIAARILATTRRGEGVHDSAGALSRMLRAQALRGARPVLLVDDLHEVPPATLAKLLALAADSRVDVRVVAAGAAGEELDARARMLPQPMHRIAVADPWTNADVERLLACIGASLPSAAARQLVEIDAGELLRTSGGNPRLLRAALAERLRQPNPAPNVPPNQPDIAPPAAAPPPSPTASSAPARYAPTLPPARPPAPPPPRAPAAPAPSGPRSPLPRPPPESPGPPHAPRSARSRSRRHRSVAHTRRVVSAVVFAAIGLALLGRLSAITEQMTATAGAYAADAQRWVAAWRPPEIPVADMARSGAAYVSERLRAIGEWKLPRPKLPEIAAAWPERTEPADASAQSESTKLAPAPAPIRVAVNSDPWSDVEVDGEAAGSTPFTIDLSPGSHRLRASMADGRVVEKQIEVAPGENRVVLR
jgi:type II secretory pathway predicted ATPase ExeA